MLPKPAICCPGPKQRTLLDASSFPAYRVRLRTTLLSIVLILSMTEDDRYTVDQFFKDAPLPTTSIDSSVQAFIRKHTPVDGLQGRPIVCVTSGGTTVPLERRCIRFIDNFSGGTRGALSVEQFLQVQWSYLRHFRPCSWCASGGVTDPCRQGTQSFLCTERAQSSLSPKDFLARSCWIS